MLNHVLAGYIAVGVGNPKKFPDKPQLSGGGSGKRNGFMMDSDSALDAFIEAQAEKQKEGS